MLSLRLFFFVALCASNTPRRSEKQMLWETNEISVTNRHRDWLMLCLWCGNLWCEIYLHPKSKSPFFAAWYFHSVWKYSCFSRASHLHELILHLVCRGLHLAVSPKGLCKQHGWTSFPIPQAIWGLSEQISWQIYMNKAPIHHCPARMFCSNEGWFKTQDTQELDVIKPES